MHTPELDFHLLRQINQEWREFWLDWAMPFVSGWVFLVLLGVAALVYLYRRQYKISGRGMLLAVIFCAAAGLLNDCVVDLVKAQAGRARPADALPLVHDYDRDAGVWRQNPAEFRPVPDVEKDSFYSGHASGIMAISLAVMLCFPPLRAWLWLAPLLVGYSRIYLGRHYPTDILVGWLAGAALVYLLWLAWKKISPGSNAWLTEAGRSS